MPAVSSQAAFAEALFRPADATPAGLTTARGEPDALRFGVYRNNVMASLIRALEQKFPVIAQIVGDDFFRLMARGFILVERPSSPVIARYGDAFPAFIAQFEPAASLAYLPDVARLEAAWMRAYHAADAGPLGLATLGAIPAEELVASRLVAHPAAALLRSQFPIGSIWAHHQVEIRDRAKLVGAETVLVCRPGPQVQVHVLPEQDGAFAQALLAGEGLADAAAAATHPGFDFGKALVGLVSLGAFSAVTPA